MKISEIKISVFELPTNTAICDMEEVPYGPRLRWQQSTRQHQPEYHSCYKPPSRVADVSRRTGTNIDVIYYVK